MTQLVLWIIIAYGLSNIVVYGSIFNGPRRFISNMSDSHFPVIQPIGQFLKAMTSCMMCFGFHAGWFLSLTIFSPVHELLQVNSLSSWFFDAMLSSGAVWAINSIIEWFEENRPKINQD